MKKIILLLSFFTSISITSIGQDWWNIDFEDPVVFNKICIDTISNSNNIWKIGQPEKTLFTSAHSPTHAIITDSINPYPVNDTSSFIITHVRPDVLWGHNELLLLDFYFKIDCDSLNDFGKVELSMDNGNTWYDVLTLDTLVPGITWLEPKPVLTGTNNSWIHFSVNLRDITFQFGLTDTLLYKFTFISDGVQTDKDGWMIDDFLFEDIWEGIKELRNDNLISISPNPVSDMLFINRRSQGNNEGIEVIDPTGRIMMSVKPFKLSEIDVTHLTPGMYLLKYTNTEGMAIKRFVVTY